MQCASIRGAVVAALLACAGCAQHAQLRYPYRSAALNVEFVSAYPRPVDFDPLSLNGGTPEEEDATDVALSRPPSSEPGPAAHDAVESAADSVYNPQEAAEYVTAVYAANDTATSEDGTTEIIDIYRYVQVGGAIYHSTRPAVGDLVFFHNTFDRNGDGRSNDWYTHVGVVESIDDAGNISVLSYLDSRVSRSYMNLERPEEATDEQGETVNTTMRRRSSSDPPYTQYLASELFAGFGSLLGERTQFLVIDNWHPGMSVAQFD